MPHLSLVLLMIRKATSNLVFVSAAYLSNLSHTVPENIVVKNTMSTV